MVIRRLNKINLYLKNVNHYSKHFYLFWTSANILPDKIVIVFISVAINYRTPETPNFADLPRTSNWIATRNP